MPLQTPINLNDIKESGVPTTGKLETNEDQFLKKKLERESKLEGTAHFWKRCLLSVSFIIIILIIVIRVYCLVAPVKAQWLTDGQTARIDEFFVHGTIGAIIASYIGKYFREERK